MLSMTFSALAAALSIQAVDPAPASSPPSPASPTAPSEATAPPQGPLTWDDIPEALRIRLETQLGKPKPQAVLTVEAAVGADADFRTVDHGAVLSVQTVRPATFATIETPARNARKYGPAGAVMWAGIDGSGDWWCWRNGDRFPNWIVPSDIYCYRDTDADGDFDVVMENDAPETGLGQSRFQFTTLGHDERLSDVVTYRPGGQADFAEKVVIRYDGPGQARVGADGRLVDGVVLFEMLTGPAVPRAISGNLLVAPAPGAPTSGLDQVSLLPVILDAEGKGRLEDGRGVVIEVDRVNLDGTARVKLVSALPAGRTLLFPPPTREDVLFMLNRMAGRTAP